MGDSCQSDSEEDTAPKNEVERFIQENGVDDSAARYLRRSSAEVQQYAIGCGTLLDCYNPSSALMRRILDAKKAVPLPIGTGEHHANPGAASGSVHSLGAGVPKE